MSILTARRQDSFGRFDATILALYSILVAWITIRHEFWFDEAQAWLIARDSGLAEIFLKRLHYEGTPGLWHFLLWTLVRLHFSFTAAHWMTALGGIAAVYLLLRYSPFPPIVRAVLPFCFALVFQTAIIARSYSLVPLLVFSICVVLTGRRNRPLVLAVLAGLLANTCLFGVLLAIGLILAYLIQLRATGVKLSLRSLRLPGTILTFFFVIAIYTAAPAPDINFGTADVALNHPAINRFLGKITATPLPVPTVKPESLPMKSLPPGMATATTANIQKGILRRLLDKPVTFLAIAFFPVSEFNLVAAVFYGVLLWWLFRHKSLYTLLPFILLILGGARLGLAERHSSLVSIALIAALWLAWNHVPPAKTAMPLNRAFLGLLVIVLIEQAAWTGYAAAYDIRKPYDGSAAAAHYILPLAQDHTIATIGADPLTLQSYSRHKLYYNQSVSYWQWKRNADPDTHIAEVVAEHPDFILDGEGFTGDVLMIDQVLLRAPHGKPYDLRDKAAYLQKHGYRETHRFCGRQPAHFGFWKKTCVVVYEPVAPAPR